MNAEFITPQFDMIKWIYAARELHGQVKILEQVYAVLPQINEQIELSQGEASSSKDEETNIHTGKKQTAP